MNSKLDASLKYVLTDWVEYFLSWDRRGTNMLQWESGATFALLYFLILWTRRSDSRVNSWVKKMTLNLLDFSVLGFLWPWTLNFGTHPKIGAMETSSRQTDLHLQISHLTLSSHGQCRFVYYQVFPQCTLQIPSIFQIRLWSSKP